MYIRMYVLAPQHVGVGRQCLKCAAILHPSLDCVYLEHYCTLDEKRILCGCLQHSCLDVVVQLCSWPFKSRVVYISIVCMPVRTVVVCLDVYVCM